MSQSPISRKEWDDILKLAHTIGGACHSDGAWQDGDKILCKYTNDNDGHFIGKERDRVNINLPDHQKINAYIIYERKGEGAKIKHIDGGVNCSHLHCKIKSHMGRGMDVEIVIIGKA